MAVQGQFLITYNKYIQVHAVLCFYMKYTVHLHPVFFLCIVKDYFYIISIHVCKQMQKFLPVYTDVCSFTCTEDCMLLRTASTENRSAYNKQVQIKDSFNCDENVSDIFDNSANLVPIYYHIQRHFYADLWEQMYWINMYGHL